MIRSRVNNLEIRMNWLEAAFLKQSKDLEKRINELKETKRDKVKTGEAGPTMGTYNRVDEVNPRVAKKAKGHVVTPKTPQQIELETQRKIKAMNEPVRTVPNE